MALTHNAILSRKVFSAYTLPVTSIAPRSSLCKIVVIPFAPRYRIPWISPFFHHNRLNLPYFSFSKLKLSFSTSVLVEIHGHFLFLGHFSSFLVGTRDSKWYTRPVVHEELFSPDEERNQTKRHVPSMFTIYPPSAASLSIPHLPIAPIIIQVFFHFRSWLAILSLLECRNERWACGLSCTFHFQNHCILFPSHVYTNSKICNISSFVIPTWIECFIGLFPFAQPH